MENRIYIIIIVLAVILAAFMVLAAIRSREKKHVPNYRALFVIGISWIPIGLATENTTFWVIGIVFFIVGLANRKEWGQETRWSDMPPQARRMKMLFVGGMVFLLLLALLYFLLTRTP